MDAIDPEVKQAILNAARDVQAIRALGSRAVAALEAIAAALQEDVAGALERSAGAHELAALIQWKDSKESPAAAGDEGEKQEKERAAEVDEEIIQLVDGVAGRDDGEDDDEDDGDDDGIGNNADDEPE